MKLVSNNYKSTMNLPVRPTSQFQARLEMRDRGVESDSTVTETPKVAFSTGIFDKTHVCDYITFEKDYFAVGGNTRILPESNYLSNGFVSSVMTDANGAFVQIPTVDVVLNSVKTFVGMTYTFAKSYPTQIRVTAFLNGVQVQQFISTPDSLDFVDDTNHIVDCDHVKFEFLRMSEPYRRLRVSRMVFGLVKVFNTSDVISTDHIAQVDPISSSLPYERLTMRIANYDRDYNPDNPQGAWEYFKNGLPLQVRYGTTVDSTIEWVDAAYLYLSDAPTVENNTATFEASDALSYMTGTYYKGLWRSEGISLYDLAADVFADAGVTNYEIPAPLQDVITYAPMPVLTHRECLQIIANAGRCTLYTDVSGKIIMRLQLNADVTVTDSGHMPWSNAQRTYTGGAQYDYITFEPNKWRVRSSQERFIVPDNDDYKPTCFESSAISGDDSRFGNYPTLYVAYSLPVSSYQFKIGFDSFNEDYAPDFNVIFSKDGTIVKNVQVRGNTEIVYTVNEEVLNYTLVTIQILSTSRPHHRIRVESIDSGRVTDFYLDFSVALVKPKVLKSEELRSVDMTVHSYSVPENIELLYQAQSVDIYGEKTIQVSYVAATDITATITNGTLVASTFYAETGFLTIQADGEVQVMVEGKPLTIKQSTVSVQMNGSGEVCPLDNPLISTAPLAQNVGAWVGNYLKCRNTYETNFRQDFRLDANDVIYIQSEFEEMIPARITKLQYKLPGQNGAISVRRLT